MVITLPASKSTSTVVRICKDRWINQRLIRLDDALAGWKARWSGGFKRRPSIPCCATLGGARGLTNDIQVVQKLPISEGKPAIEEVFRQGSIPNSKRLSVGAKNSCATIAGDVHSHGELMEVERWRSNAGSRTHRVGCGGSAAGQQLFHDQTLGFRPCRRMGLLTSTIGDIVSVLTKEM